jgi:predicted transcriptional regulator of viral defense system
MQKPTFESSKANLLAWAQMRQKSTIRLGEVGEILHLSLQQEKKMLSRLALAGVITRLTTGLYALPTRLPLGGRWMAPTELVLNELMRFYGGQYQLTGLGVFNRYRLSNQIANVTIVYNDKISGWRRIGNSSFQFIKVPARRLGGFERKRMPSGLELNYPTLGRTLMDAVYDWPRFNTLPRAYQWIKETKKNRRAIEDLVECTIKYGNVSTRRRVGYWLEALNADPKLVMRLFKSVKPTKSFIPLVPRRKQPSTTSKRWGIIINA